VSLASAYSREVYHSEEEEDPLHPLHLHPHSHPYTSTTSSAPLVCVHVLWGHQSPVRCISYSSPLDVVLSGGEDGRLCLHSVRDGSYVRCITHRYYMYMYVYVYVYICMYVCIYACMCMHVCVCVYVCMYICMYVCVCVCV
jgi:WD40 repeat protein